MRRFLLLAAIAMLPGAAGAADMPAKAYNAVVPVTSTPAWQGFYLGVHGGYSWSQIHSALIEETFDIGKMKPDSYLFGAHAGYNWQFGNLVPGVEVDVTYAGKSDTVVIDKETEVAGKVKYLGTARARLGLALNEGMMVYGTGGLAWANAQVTAPTLVDGGLTSSANHFGWVGGAGLEFKLFTNSWIGRLEYLHYDMGGSSYFGIVDATLKQDVVRAAISYRFSH